MPLQSNCIEKIAISGSWRTTNPLVEYDVLQFVRWAICAGHTIFTGGALGVDFIATAEAMRLMEDLRLKNKKEQLRVWLPTPLETYIEHFRNRAREGVIAQEQAEALIDQLQRVMKNYNLFTLDHTACNPKTYYDRNEKVIQDATRLAAFHVNNSEGVQDAIDKATARSLKLDIYRYTIPTE